MGRRLISAALLGCITACPGTAIGQGKDPAPAVMLTESYFDNQRKADRTPAPLISVSRQAFLSAYDKAGKPKVVFLLGERLSGLVSDWHSQHRLTINASATGSEHTQGADSHNLTAAHEYRRESVTSRSRLLTSAQWDSYEYGFRATLLEYGIELINRDLAMRLLDSEVRANTRSNPQDDNQRLEMDMLRKHGKLLVEVLPYREDRRKHESIGYNVTMTSLENAAIVADDRIAIPVASTQYRPGASGYAKQRPREKLEYEPGAGGYRALEEPQDLWAEQGTLAAQATLQLLYERWLRP